MELDFRHKEQFEVAEKSSNNLSTTSRANPHQRKEWKRQRKTILPERFKEKRLQVQIQVVPFFVPLGTRIVVPVLLGESLRVLGVEWVDVLAGLPMVPSPPRQGAEPMAARSTLDRWAAGTRTGATSAPGLSEVRRSSHERVVESPKRATVTAKRVRRSWQIGVRASHRWSGVEPRTPHPREGRLKALAAHWQPTCATSMSSLDQQLHLPEHPAIRAASPTRKADVEAAPVLSTLRLYRGVFAGKHWWMSVLWTSEGATT